MWRTLDHREHVRQHDLDLIYLPACGVNDIDREAVVALPPVASCRERAGLQLNRPNEIRVDKSWRRTAVISDSRWRASHSGMQWDSARFEF